MMKVKKTKSLNKIPQKYLVPLLLLFALVIIGVCITYAWFLNIINVDGMDMHTGNFKYEFSGFYKDANGELQQDFTLSTEDPNSEAIQKESLTATTQSSTLISPLENGTGEIYYVVKKLPGSVDLALSINFTIAVQDVESIGGFWYEIATVKGVSGENSAKQIVDLSKVEMPGITDTENGHVIYNIETDVRKEILSDADYWCFRLTYGLKDNAVSPAYTGDTLYIYPVLCVAQVGGLPDDIGNKEPIKVRSAGELERALSTYTVGQEIQILNDVTYEGDLIFNRPVTLKPWGAKLTVIGDLRYTYAGAGQFYINTSQNGFLEVLHVEDTASGGNIYIETPNAGMSFIGKNNKDIVVDGDVLAEASYNAGLFISKSRLEDRSGNLKSIYLRGRTFLDVDYQTQIREVGVFGAPLYSVKIVNNGTVGTIRLNNMANSSAPPSNIHIENHSVIENSIILPSWSMPYKEDGNTRVIVHQSAGGTTSISNTVTSAFQNEHIEYEAQEFLVEKAEDNENHITVHYMNDLDGSRRSLEQIIKEYQEKTDDKKIPESAMITYMKVECYGDVTLTATDYIFIRNNMTSLVTLDLSKAVSVDLKVPDNAFNGSMAKLETVYMSETDTTWGNNLFGNTNVIDIKIPLLAVTMSGNTFKKSDTETVKYIHVQQATTKLTLPSTSYIFVPDENTVPTYASGNNKVFVEATRFTSAHGDFFLRMLGGTCVFVTYAGDANDWYNAFKSVEAVTLDNAPDGSVRSYLRIDMSSVKVSLGEQIISSIDGYAFYNRFKLENASNINERYYIDFGNVITSIGDYAFTNCDMIVGVEGAAVNYLGQYAFYNCSKLVKMVLPSLTSITPKQTYAIYNCTALQWVETGVMDKAINDSQAYSCINGTPPNLKIHIVHSTGEENLEIIKLHKISYSGTSKNCYAFVPDNVYSIYAGSGNYRILNVKDCEISFYPEIPSTNIYEVPKFAVSTDPEGSKALLVCIEDKLEAGDVFTNYPSGVSKIGTNAFRYVTIHSETPTSSLIFPDCVTHIEPYAFHNTSSKNYHTLDLNNVVSVERYAFENNKMIAIKGENVEWLGDCAFQGAKAYTVELPSWRYGYAQVHAYGYYFQACPNLRYAYVGPCDNIRNWAFYNCPELTSVFIDAKNRGGNTTKIPNLGWYTDLETYNAFVSGGKSVLADHTDLENVVDDFGDFIFADPKIITATVDNVSGTIIIPQSVCVKNDDGTLTYQKSLSESISGDYTTPEYIYKLDQTMYFLGEEREVYTIDPTVGGASAGIFTQIGTNAYYGVGFDASAKITIAPSVRSIGKTAFKKCAAAEFDLLNVEEIGSNCFQAAQFNKITALNLKKLNGSCFISCANLTEIYLPSFETLSGSSPFSSSGLESITLGKNTKNLGSSMFSGCSNLISVVIQALEVPTATTPFPDSIVPNITLSVRKSAQYITGDATSWQKIPIAQISYFDNITTINGAEFYWDIIDENKKTVEIIMILFPDSWQEPTDGKFVIPSTVTHIVPGAEGEADITTTYTVISVSEGTIRAITAKFYYTSLTLPYALQTIDFSQAVLSPALEEFVIGEAVDGYTPLFTAPNGVLHNADGTILLIYPQGKQDASYTVSDSVTTIAKDAFFSANFADIIIEGTVIIMDNAFESCSQLRSVTFSNSEENKISMFVGRDIFKSCYAIEKIYVPESKLDQYVQSVIYDRTIADMFAKIEAETPAE